MTQLAAFFESVKLPSMSEVAHALIQSLNDDDVGIPEIRDLISQDQHSQPNFCDWPIVPSLACRAASPRWTTPSPWSVCRRSVL